MYHVLAVCLHLTNLYLCVHVLSKDLFVEMYSRLDEFLKCGVSGGFFFYQK